MNSLAEHNLELRRERENLKEWKRGALTLLFAAIMTVIAFGHAYHVKQQEIEDWRDLERLID